MPHLVGISTSLIAGMAAIYDNDVKKIIAFSTLRQLGLIILARSNFVQQCDDAIKVRK